MRSQSEGDETKYSKSDLDVMLLNKKVDQRNVIFQQRIDQLRNKCVSCDPVVSSCDPFECVTIQHRTEIFLPNLIRIMNPLTFLVGSLNHVT